ncbi:MAG TPA: tripartite tricarboxylate transporter substrate binding protein [Burkholderiales bacterium]|jgi:tripartite-type tricarboxylate transporter receptor subunit TctC
MKIVAALLIAFFAVACTGASAQGFPSRTVVLVVPFTPATGIDILARAIAPKLSERWKQPVVVDNKPGASGNIGTDFVAKAAPDGYTLMVTVNTYTITPALFKNLPYDPVEDLAPIGKIALATYTFAVNPSVFPAHDMKEAVALIRAHPGKYFFASPGSGTPHHVGMELIKQRLGLEVTHVPYKGFAGAMTDLVGGQVQMMFTLIHSSIPYVRAGKLRALAVTGAARSPQYPEAPTFREQGIDFMDDVDAWYAVMAPGQTPAALVARLNADVNAVMALPDVREQLVRQGLIPVTSTPGELAALIRTDLVRWSKVVKDANIKVD